MYSINFIYLIWTYNQNIQYFTRVLFKSDLLVFFKYNTFTCTRNMFKYMYVCSSTLVQYSAQAWAQQAAANI